jgi:hypothetical protein
MSSRKHYLCMSCKAIVCHITCFKLASNLLWSEEQNYSIMFDYFLFLIAFGSFGKISESTTFLEQFAYQLTCASSLVLYMLGS